jgi:hypothetical protein
VTGPSLKQAQSGLESAIGTVEARMSDELKRTVRILRHPKVTSDARGRTVWVDPVESAELELVSTVMLERLLSSDDENRKQKLKDAAAGKDGVLAHNLETDSFEIIDDADLMAMLEMAPGSMDANKPADVIYEPLSSLADTGEELSLVSTQALRRILKLDDETDASEDDDESADRGFNPYDNS